MDLRKLKTLIDLVSESGISELEITEGEGRVRIVKASAHPVMPMPAVVAAPIAVAPAPGFAEGAAPPTAAASAPSAGTPASPQGIADGRCSRAAAPAGWGTRCRDRSPARRGPAPA